MFQTVLDNGYSHGENKDKDMALQTYLILLNHYTCPIPVLGEHFYDNFFSFGK